jgi:hypothetical protein
MEKLFKIHPDDNVLVVRRIIEPGDAFVISGTRVVFDKSLGLGHKIAEIAIPKGGKVVKFGVPIGSASEDIAPGDYVHLHNLKSDYLPTYTLDHEFSKS